VCWFCVNQHNNGVGIGRACEGAGVCWWGLSVGGLLNFIVKLWGIQVVGVCVWRLPGGDGGGLGGCLVETKRLVVDGLRGMCLAFSGYRFRTCMLNEW